MERKSKLREIQFQTALSRVYQKTIIKGKGLQESTIKSCILIELKQQTQLVICNKQK